ncbi:MAG: ABC transporter ATP-binding protein [Acidobacteriota bacterium]
MSDIAIRVTDLSKRYKIGALKQRHNTLRDEIVFGVRSLMGANRQDRGVRAEQSTLWALKDVSFEVRAGELLGIVGRNGAGKSTLLKILSRITEPSSGRCDIYGRMAALLEVGTGFHGELTGRENVYLNGAILGMKKVAIDRNFDEIVAFAEVEKFIDTPVKRYSSGMHVRLAFAVAAHLEPEILIVDEVLAVGDLNFQNKCIGKMSAVAKQGRTVLFVSHNMGAVTNLCTSGMWIDHGQVRMSGEIKTVVDSYIKGQSGPTEAGPSRRHKGTTSDARVTNARLTDARGDACDAFMMGETIVLEFDVEFFCNAPAVNFTIDFKRKDMGMHVLSLQSDDVGFAIDRVVPGTRRVRMEMPNCMLYPTSYEIRISVWEFGKTFDYVDGICHFSMIQSDVTRRTSALTVHREAIYFAPSVWKDVSAA